MKLVMTLLARDEADLVDAQVSFHLNAGVDFVIATDNLSKDETTEILESYAKAGRLHLIREDGEYLRQADWITRMGRMAATEFGADWVIHSDADEFWWPRGDSLKDVLASIPSRYGIVRALLRHFVPRRADDRAHVRIRAHQRSTKPLPSEPEDHPSRRSERERLDRRATFDRVRPCASPRLVPDRVLPLPGPQSRAVRTEVLLPADGAGSDSESVLRPGSSTHCRGSGPRGL
ncbi:MAG: glycosyltransferase family 2 protein [Actinobacteria bacterium]|nr:MAG: glycosyltransferase family 2 protein [Actinomycetota bacterium]